MGAVSSRTGKLEAIRTTSMMVHGPFYLPDDGKTWMGKGKGTIHLFIQCERNDLDGECGILWWSHPNVAKHRYL